MEQHSFTDNLVIFFLMLWPFLLIKRHKNEGGSGAIPVGRLFLLWRHCPGEQAHQSHCQEGLARQRLEEWQLFRWIFPHLQSAAFWRNQITESFGLAKTLEIIC